MASVVTLIIEKTMKKIFKKKIISDLPTLMFSRYETGTTGIFFYASLMFCAYCSRVENYFIIEPKNSKKQICPGKHGNIIFICP
jgi:hypothetical protein